MKCRILFSLGYGPVIGKDEFGWAWDIPSRMLVHDNENCGVYPQADPQQFIHNTIIMELNLDEGTLHYMMEGVDLGPGFSGEYFVNLSLHVLQHRPN
jgi:hypothetical protein